MQSKRKIKKKNTFAIVLIFFSGFLLGNLITNLAMQTQEEVTHVYIIYGSEKASWMTVAYADFMGYWEEKHPDEKIMLHMHPYGSSDSMIAILNGEIFPTIWSPASSIWMPLLNTKWKDYTGSKENIVDIDAAVKIIYSPIVIATWEKFNKTHKISGFSDLRDLNNDEDVTVRMAHTDPRLSNSGFMSVIMALAAATGKPAKDFEMDDLTDDKNQDWLADFESSAVMYGKSTGFLAQYMLSEGPETLNIAFLYENLVRDISNSAEDDKIVAIYPEEGTLYSDHPFCIMDADWVSDKQREVAEEFLDFLNKKSTVESAMEYGFRPINPSIELDPDVFNFEESGIAFNITVPELEVPKDGDVILRIPDLWLLCKATA